MAQTLTCSQGHRWLAADADGVHEAVTQVCPVCGEAPSPTLDAATRAPAATVAGPPEAWVPAAPPAVPGYEILGELGRGGMGVVFKALHLKLNRVVALKTLLSGAHAGPDLLVRFQREAELLARLTHPNIVQIHEVGWAEPYGPYLALEYVEGGSLARQLARAPQPPRRAAEVVAVLARAVHFAHERGVLHRDLKPANVLLTADGTPKVTDFGLARLLEAGAAGPDSPTRTGAILGTPSYMAPEQASGVARAPTAAIDVYALGAILYEMLTGRPPFLAEGPVETTLRVMTEDPVPPRRLQPKVSRDLETICLRCLHKEPRQRYPSAAAVADDLQRFLDGRPIEARPAGPVERLVKWARRRPAVAALAAVSVLAVAAGIALAAWYQFQLYEKNRALTNAVAETGKEKDLYAGLLVGAVDAMGEYGDAADDALAPLPGGEKARREILEKRLEFFAPFLTLDPDNPRLQERKARALVEVAKIHEKLGDPAKAEIELSEAVRLYETAGGPSPTPGQREELGRACVERGLLLSDLRQSDEAAQVYNRGIGLLQGRIDEGSYDAAVRRDLAAAYHDLALLQRSQRRWDDALAAFAKSADLGEGLIADDPGNDSYKVLLAENDADRAGLYRLRGEPERGRADADAALALLEQVGPDVKGREGYRSSLAAVRCHRGLLLFKTDPAAARKDLEAAADLWGGLSREFPAVPRYRFEEADLRLLLGRMAYADGRPADAETPLRAADGLYDGLAAEWKDDADYRAGRRASHYFLGTVLMEQGKNDEAAGFFADLVEWDPDNADDQLQLGVLCLRRGAAEEDLATTVSLVKTGAGLTVVPNPLGCVGCLYSLMAHWRRASDLYREAGRRLRFAEQSGRDGLDPTSKKEAAQSRWLAARGLGRVSLWLSDAEAVNDAAETLGEVAEGWPSLYEKNDAAQNLREASRLSSQAMLMEYADDRLPEGEREARAAAYAEAALGLLHKAVAAGYRDAGEIRGSPPLAALLAVKLPALQKAREDLRQLLADLEKKPAP